MSDRPKNPENGSPRLSRSLSPLAVWALSFGCAVGWGSFVMPGTTFLPIAGPLGTVLGVAAGALIMFVIGVNYSFLMNRYPDAGGTFSYTKHVFGYDHGFLSAWFLGLVYLAIIWANATAIPLIFRNIVGDTLRFGFHYTIAGYDVYFGEILVSVLSLVVFGLVCLHGTKTVSLIQIFLAVLLIVGIVTAFALTFTKEGAAQAAFTPAYSPDHPSWIGILFIVFLAPWAYAGFESVSHSTEEFRFSPKKSLLVMTVALVTAAVAYILLALIGSSAVPADHPNWFDYIKNLGSHSGIEGIPVFNGIYRAIGKHGLVLLGVTAAAGIITGLIGNMFAASRMLYAMAEDGLLPSQFVRLNCHGAPTYAILFLILLSLPIPFLGRSAIGWIVDVNTIGVTIAYAYTSAAAFRAAEKGEGGIIRVTGLLGVLISGFFLLYFLIPNFSSITTLSTESYLILLVWAVLGFVVFYFVYKRDAGHRMGKSTTVWIVLLLLIFFTSFIWVIGATEAATDSAVSQLTGFYTNEIRDAGIPFSVDRQSKMLLTFDDAFSRVTGTILRNSVIQFVLIMISILIIFRIYGSVQRSHQTAVKDKTIAEAGSQAKSNFLSNMSHDIRTPMNAIIGYVTLAKREKDLSPRVEDYLTKIEASSEHLLALINDVLEMSRIESGKVELMPIPCDIRSAMDEVRDLFSTQMRQKHLKYEVTYDGVEHPLVLCDRNRLNRVLLNLVSNACKFTPEGGTVSVTLSETGCDEDHVSYKLSVKDTGFGMSKEFAAKVFEAFEREKTQTVENIQGTGLGTAITKSIVDLMGGTIDVFSEQGKGSEFVINVAFPIDRNATPYRPLTDDEKAAASAFKGMRVLIVEDDPANRDVERTLFEEAGFVVETAENGEDAVELVAASTPGEYAVVLMDIEMPVKNGYDATRLIRSLRNPELANVPIVALTAKAFSEDIAAARDAGMNGHIAKPIDMKHVIETLTEVLS